jgi:hypothetical protein
MSRSVTLTIPGDPAELSPIARLHRQARAKLVRDWKAKTWDAWEKAGRPRLVPPVEIRFLICRARTMDRDNLQASGSLKAMVDALTDRGSLYEDHDQLLPDDNAAMVSYAPIELHIARLWKDREQVIMTVGEIDGPSE